MSIISSSPSVRTAPKSNFDHKKIMAAFRRKCTSAKMHMKKYNKKTRSKKSMKATVTKMLKTHDKKMYETKTSLIAYIDGGSPRPSAREPRTTKRVHTCGPVTCAVRESFLASAMPYINWKVPAKPTWCVAQRGAAPCQQCQTDQNLIKVQAALSICKAL